MDQNDPNAITQLNLRLTLYEKNRLRINAASAGCSVSEYIRQTAVYAKAPSPIVVDMEELARCNFELRKQGVNLNQLMRVINTYGVGSVDPIAVGRLLQRVDAAVKDATEIIVGVRNQFK